MKFLSTIPHLAFWTIIGICGLIFLVDLIRFRIQVRRYIKDFRRFVIALNKDVGAIYKQAEKNDKRLNALEKKIDRITGSR